MIASASHPPPVAATLATWHRMVASHNMAERPSLLHADATFRSPMAFKPYASAKAVNLIRFDAEGRIVDFEVMIRPLSGLQALGEQMGQRIGPLLAALKTPS